MSRRDSDPGHILFAVLFATLSVAASLTLVAGLIAHPAVAATWALVATLAAGWLGFLYLGRVQEDHLRGLGAEPDREPLPAPEPPEQPSVAEVIVSHRLGRRIGDAERDVVVAALHTHFAAGRLDAAELDGRLSAALAARTVDDLVRVVRGLPSERTGR